MTTVLRTSLMPRGGGDEVSIGSEIAADGAAAHAFSAPSRRGEIGARRAFS